MQRREVYSILCVNVCAVSDQSLCDVVMTLLRGEMQWRPRRAASFGVNVCAMTDQSLCDVVMTGDRGVVQWCYAVNISGTDMNVCEIGRAHV